MKFRVIGSSKETGGRMTLEFEADSRAAAERKASESGMSVNRVENIPDADFHPGDEPNARQRNPARGVLILIILAIVFWWFFLRPHGFNLPAR